MEPAKGSVLLVEAGSAALELLGRSLTAHGYLVHTHQAADAPEQVLGAALQISPDVVMLPLTLDETGLFQRLREQLPATAIVALGESDASAVRERALRRGADRYLTLPTPDKALLALMQRAVEKAELSRRVAAAEARSEQGSDFRVFEGLVAAHPVMQQLLNRVLQAARSKATVLIHGETGTGKELIANAIHKASKRREGPFVRLNCAALAEGLLESELFGHEKGAFTGASGQRKGRFEQADGGTLFLDEISEISPSTQVKLLRFLQERELERVGGNETVRVDVRVVAASNRDLRVLVDDGKFREDLYYRLNVVRIEVPPLRARPGDIPLLAEHFLWRFAEENEQDVQGFSEQAIQLMLDYPWPGNVRELMNVVEQAVVLADGPLIEAEHLPMRPISKTSDALALMVPGVTLAEVERYVVLKTLEAVDGSRHRAAEMLGISRRTLQYRLQEWGIEPRRFTKNGLEGA